MKPKRQSSRDESGTEDASQDRRFVALCKTLATDPRYAGTLSEHAANRASPTKRRFGSNALKVNGKIFAMMSQDTLVVKLPRARVDELVDGGFGKRFDPGHGRLMKEWLAVSAPTRLWATLVREAHDFVSAGAQRASLARPESADARATP
jgi:TfoX/Sxy family transcriptional regulator of competence genes